MPEKSPSEYEDSYQKEERLRRELNLLLIEIKQFLESGKKSIEEMRELPEKFSSIEKEIEDLSQVEKDLKAELDKMKADYEKISDLDEQIDASRDISEQQSKIWDNWSKQFNLYKEMKGMCEEEVGLKGDFEGTESIVKMKLQRLDELIKQLENLKNQDDY